MFFKRKKMVNVLSGIKAEGDITLSISNVTIGDGQTIDIINGSVIINGQHVADVNGRKIEIVVQSNAVVKSIQSDVAVNVRGKVSGDISAQTINCDDVNGNVTAKQNVNCNDVRGNVQAGGNVNCDNIKGSVTAQRINRS